MIGCPCGVDSFSSTREISHHLQTAHLLQPGTAWMLAEAIAAGRVATLVDIASLSPVPRKPLAAAPPRHEAPVQRSRASA